MNTASAASLLHKADLYRIDISRKLDSRYRSELGQFMTPEPIAKFMASLFNIPSKKIHLFDPGAGVGSLTAAFIENVLSHHPTVTHLDVDTFELDSALLDYLSNTLEDCRRACEKNSVDCTAQIIARDFIEHGVELLIETENIFGSHLLPRYTHCITNPPYKKIHSASRHRTLLRRIGIETSNLYSAFLAIAIKLLAKEGELVAIVPRSFCNGPYFKPFRKLLLKEMALTHLHVFESRTESFKEDEVLQENIIFHAVKGVEQGPITITSSDGPSFDSMTSREVDLDQVVKPGDHDQVIHIAVSDFDQSIVNRASVFNYSLDDLGIEVSTGPVVDFRLRDDIYQQADQNLLPLIYPSHFKGSYINWPQPDSKKPNAIKLTDQSKKWLLSAGWYTLTKRFTAKEEKRRIVAAVFSPQDAPGDFIGFENHLNVFHCKKAGLDPDLAKGLAIYLNSTLLDLYFRQFSGHTQVNVADLRMLHYPSLETLKNIGKQIDDVFPEQAEIDEIIEKEINKMTQQKSGNPLQMQQKISESLKILKALGMPRAQQNERSALTLLALVDLKPDDDWQSAGNPLIGITPIMEFCRDHYMKNYAPNSRETFRRFTMHQFVQAGIAVSNPDDPDRPTNSPHWVYQITPETLDLLKNYGRQSWNDKLDGYLKIRGTLVERYAKRRKMRLIPLQVSKDREVYLSPGAHSKLIVDIVNEFGPRFAPGGETLYIGDTGDKEAFNNKDRFKELGLEFDPHGKFPDVVLYDANKGWLFLIEAVTSHGPVDPKRYEELSAMFKDGKAGIVFVTAFPDRKTLAKYLAEISWQTEVWVAENPTHMIHFDGEKFLGPYS